MFKHDVRRTRLVAIAALLMVPLGFIAWNVVLTMLQATKLHNIHETFPGLPRAKAYAKLSKEGLTAQGWIITHSYEGFSGIDWPAHGDVAIDFPHVSRKSLPATCGATAIAVLQFKGDQIAEVGESVRYYACL